MVATTAAAVVLLALLLGAARPPAAEGAAAAATAGTAMTGLVAASIARLHWRSTRNTLSMWLGIGVAVLTVFDPLVGLLVTLAGASGPGIAGEVAVAARAAGLLLIGVAILLPDVLDGDRPSAPVVIGAATIAVVVAASAWGQWERPPLSDVDVGAGPRPVAAALVVGWLLVMGAAWWRAVLQERRLAAWIGVAALAWACAAALRVIGVGSGLAAPSLDLVAVVVCLPGLMVEVSALVANQQRQLRSLAPLQQVAVDSRRLHDTRNALLALEGAAHVLRAEPDPLDPQRRRRLADEVSREVGRVADLLDLITPPQVLRDDARSALPAVSGSGAEG